MKSILSSLFLTALLSHVASAAIVVTFDELRGDVTTANGSYFNGYTAGALSGSWQTAQGASFNTQEWGPGWSYSNVNDATTAGYLNQFAAVTGSGYGGSGNYALATGDGAYFNLPEATRIESLLISNSTYAYLAMRDSYYNAKKFGGDSGNDPDFFKVTFTGYSGLGGTDARTGSKDFYLSDFRNLSNEPDYMVDDWRLVDLSGLGDARSIALTFTGSDNDPVHGLNTPSYAAFDNITLSAVPEPGSFLLLTCLAATLTLRRNRSELRGRAA